MSAAVCVCDLRPDTDDPTILRGRLGEADVRVLPLDKARDGVTHCLWVVQAPTPSAPSPEGPS